MNSQMGEKTWPKFTIFYLTLPLCSGYNAAYLLTTEHGPCVLKLAPKPSVRVLRHENNIIDAEVRALNILSRVQAPLRTPKVLAFDQSCTIAEAPYAILEFIPGEILDPCRKLLNKSDSLVIDEACGQHLRFVNSITRESSGDDRPGGPVSGFGLCAIHAPRFSTWREAFSSLLLDLLSDAEEGDVENIPHDEIKAALTSHATVFDEVTESSLVIWDMWDGNILISFSDPENKTGVSVSGTIDYERALWGDPLMETSFWALQAPSVLFEAYGAYKPSELTRTQRCRRLFYDLHLALILVIETTFRGVRELEKGGKDMELWGRAMMKTSIDGIRNF
jgi:hypothetical protein